MMFLLTKYSYHVYVNQLCQTSYVYLRPFNLCLLVSSAIVFANSLDPDQDRQNVGPEVDPYCLTLMVFLKEMF